MGKDKKYLNGEGSSANESSKAIVPKPEILDFEIPITSETTYSRPHGNEASSSSGITLRSQFIGMGFSASLVDKVIEKNGEENAELLLDILIGTCDAESSCSELYSSSSSESSSLGSLSDEDDPDFSAVVLPKEDPDVIYRNDDKRESLLKMDFALTEVNFAMEKIGEDASISDIVDFIMATRIAEEPDHVPPQNEVNHKESSDESLFSTMEKTLCLLGMGFSENDVSIAIEKLGSNATVQNLAGTICGDTIVQHNPTETKNSSSSSHLQLARNDRSFDTGNGEVRKQNPSYSPLKVKTEDNNKDSGTSNSREIYKGKRPNQECSGGVSDIIFRSRHGKSIEGNPIGKRPNQECSGGVSDIVFRSRHGKSIEGNPIGKRPKQEYDDFVEEKVDPNIFKSKPRKSLTHVVSNPPYFFHGDIENTSQSIWDKVSKFLYSIEPELVNTQFFSALTRKEGYIHNLPIENRIQIHPRSPMTIKEGAPHAKKWWPSWDSRNQLNCINSDLDGISNFCDRLGKILSESRGSPSEQHQKEILYHCQRMNLVWIGPHKLGPLDPEHLEGILGYPAGHTQALGNNLMERLKSLKHCFQTDTLGYHLSVLKNMFPEGLTILSLFSGIGGAEVTLHRLGIRLKGVVAVESSDMKRKILKNWWQKSGQTGQLEQLEEVQRLTTKKLESLIERFGGFDFIVCQNPCNQPAKVSKTETVSTSAPIFDSSLFYETSFFEFVRVFQRVRDMMERKRST